MYDVKENYSTKPATADLQVQNFLHTTGFVLDMYFICILLKLHYSTKLTFWSFTLTLILSTLNWLHEGSIFPDFSYGRMSVLETAAVPMAQSFEMCRNESHGECVVGC